MANLLKHFTLYKYLSAARALARAASTSRSRGSAVVTSESSSLRAVLVTSFTALLKAFSFAFDGVLNPRACGQTEVQMHESLHPWQVAQS
jgi:hypothetical protein